MLKTKSGKVDLSRLTDAIQRARLVLRVPRENRREMVRQYVGQHWSGEGTSERVPLNLISLYCSISQRALIPRNPRVMLSTFLREAKPVVSAMAQWVNDEVQEINLAATLRRVVLDALFSVGIAKVALATPLDALSQGWNLAAGRPFAERVDLDDFVFDVHARDFAEATFIGHRYRAPLDAVKNLGSIFGSGRKDIEPDYDNPYNLEGDERISMLGRTYLAGNTDEFVPHATLWEIYIPHERLVLTLAGEMPGVSNDINPKPLREQTWLGPDTGPYHLLGFQYVPGNPMPKGPIQDLWDLHEAINRLYRKLMRQAERSKDITAYQRSAEEDARRYQTASDGDMAGMDNPDKVRPVPGTGVNQSVFVFADHLKSLFGYQAENLDAAGGLAPQSGTLGQDEILKSATTSGLQTKQETVIEYIASVAKGLCWYWFHDPQRLMTTSWKVPGLPDYEVTRHVSPQDRQRIQWNDLGIKVDPYSLQQQTPSTRAQGVMQVINMMAPLMPLLQQQGVSVDTNNLLDMLSKYMDLPELADIMTFHEQPQQDGEGQGEEGEAPTPKMPANTTRTYKRVSQGNNSSQNQHQQLVNSLQAAQGPQGNGMVNKQ